MTIETPRGPEPQTFVKVCRRCSVQTKTSASVCPSCGNAYAGGRHRPALWLAVPLAILLVVGGGAGLALKLRHDHAVTAAADHRKQIREVAAAEAAEAKKVADKKAADEAAAQNAADQQARIERTSEIKDMQRTITTYAKRQVAAGVLDGPILYTSCDPLGGGSTDDLTAITTTFTCIVASTTNDDGTVSGYNFSATMNWDKGSYTWQLSS